MALSSIKEYLFDIQNGRVEEWIRERLSDQSLEEDSDEWQDLANQYYDYQEHLAEEAEWQAELQWLKSTDSSTLHKLLVSELDELKFLVESNIGNSREMEFMLHSNMIVKMSYSYAVTLMESFLGDTLKALISEREDFLQNAIRNVEEISKAKYSIAQLSEAELNVCSLALKHTTEILFHNMPKVKRVYEQVLGVKLKLDISKVSEITSLRHDIVHRNGYTKDQTPIDLTVKDFYQAIEDIKEFSTSLQAQINVL